MFKFQHLVLTCRDADAGSLPASRRVTGEALQTPEGPDGFLRLAAVRPGEEVRDPAVPVHAGESGAGHGAQPVRDTGEDTPVHLHTHTHTSVQVCAPQCGSLVFFLFAAQQKKVNRY